MNRIVYDHWITFLIKVFYKWILDWRMTKKTWKSMNDLMRTRFHKAGHCQTIREILLHKAEFHSTQKCRKMNVILQVKYRKSRSAKLNLLLFFKLTRSNSSIFATLKFSFSKPLNMIWRRSRLWVVQRNMQILSSYANVKLLLNFGGHGLPRAYQD